MATPKKRKSLMRRIRARAQSFVTLPNVVKCENCSSSRLPHHMCNNCGWYNGKCIIAPKEKSLQKDSN